MSAPTSELESGYYLVKIQPRDADTCYYEIAKFDELTREWTFHGDDHHYANDPKMIVFARYLCNSKCQELLTEVLIK